MVSVVIPAYNAEKYIGDCLKSVISQSYKDLEIIVVDDGSTDNTLKEALHYAESEPGLSVIHKENGGVSSARNLALTKVKGKYLFFMDADDTIEQNAIETLVSAMEDSGADFVNCQYSRWNEKGERLEDYDFISGFFEFSSDEDRMKFTTEQILPYHVGFEVWNKLFKTDIITDNKITFSEKCRIGEDLAFNLKYLMHAGSISCIPDRCLRYVIREGSAMGAHKALSRIIEENILLLEDVYEHVKTIKNQYFEENFTAVIAKVMDNSYIGHTPSEVLEAVSGTPMSDYFKQNHSKFIDSKDKIMSLYPAEIAEIKYRYHKYVFCGINGFSVKDRLELFIYDMYRKMRKRPILKDWKMPY